LKLESLMYDGHQLSLLDFGSSIRGEYIHLWPLKSYIHSHHYRHAVIETFFSLLNFFKPTQSKHTAELFARVCNNGRMIDEFKCMLGGSEVIEADFSLGLLFEDPVVSEFSAKIQRWPRDIDLRKGLLSGRWEDFKWMVSCCDACILDKEGWG
jgi:hypothetical protein